jgi:hypothetical protein
VADPTATLPGMDPTQVPMRRLLCIARHRLPETFELRPPLIGTRVEWLYFARSCRRCGWTERRWWRVDPRRLRMSGPAIPVGKYLRRLKVQAPDPLTIAPSEAPPGLGPRV